MRFLRLLTLLLSFSLAVSCEAGSVAWNTFEGGSCTLWLDDGTYYGKEVEAFNIHHYAGGATPEMNFVYTKSTSGRYLSATAIDDYINLANPAALWVLATAGETLTTLDDFQSHKVIFDCLSPWDSEPDTCGSISLQTTTQTYYLAILGNKDFDQSELDPYWAWVELQGNRKDGLSIVASAISFDAPLIVGGGLVDPTPEPTSGLLLLVGSALLLIRRPRS